MPAPYRTVLAKIEDDDLRAIAAVRVYRALNMVGGRASDHAHYYVDLLRRIGPEAFRAGFEAESS